MHTIPLDLCNYEFYAPRAASRRDPDGPLQADAHLCGFRTILLDQQIQNLSPRVYASERDTERSNLLELSRRRQRELIITMRTESRGLLFSGDRPCCLARPRIPDASGALTSEAHRSHRPGIVSARRPRDCFRVLRTCRPLYHSIRH